MEPFTLFALIFIIAIISPGVLASEEKKPEPTDEEKLAKTLAKLLTKTTTASDS